MRICLPVLFICAALVGPPPRAATTFSVPQSGLPDPLVLIAYGDIRFTQAGETQASSPAARQAMIRAIDAEHPAAIFINGDLPWHGLAADYEVYRTETRVWRDRQLRVYPALGNHEFSACEPSICLERWWAAFPQLRGRRWYSVAIGAKLVGIALDSDAPLLPGSDQRTWLEDQIASFDPAVRLVLIVIHHPPVADVQTIKLIDHNPRPNEQSLAEYLKSAAARSRARFVVSAGHIHNYERFLQDGVVYLVSGGGGASPYDVDRTASDLYRHADFPNYHYVRFTLRGQILSGEMIRLSDYAAAEPRQWQMRDRFQISLLP
ncbi:MAG: metallophosphoesterase family protein [Steroidobacteraceae bacterium]